MKVLCRVLGHRHSLEDIVRLAVKCVQDNRDDLDLSVTCHRCGVKTELSAEAAEREVMNAS